MITSATVLIASFVAALLSGLVSLCKLVDWRRQKVKPRRHEYGSFREAQYNIADSHDLMRWLPTRLRPMFSGDCGNDKGAAIEKVAKLSDVAALMKTGDGGVQSGTAPWSYLIRIADYSTDSHAWMVYRDDEGLWVADSREGSGVAKRSLFEEVAKYPGQLYWAQIAPEFRDRYNRDAVAAAIAADIEGQVQYGWSGIILLTVLRLPVLRVLAYLLKVSSWGWLQPYFERRQFCSQKETNWMRAGSLDPVPGRDAQLVVPQDIRQSMAFVDWVALVP